LTARSLDSVDRYRHVQQNIGKFTSLFFLKKIVW
jgi:hypothetical protein